MNILSTIIASVIVLTLTTSPLSARNYLETPEGSCTVKNGYRYEINCVLRDVVTSTTSMGFSQYTTKENKDVSKYLVADEGGLFQFGNIIAPGVPQCVGLASPYAIKNNESVNFMSFNRMYSFKNYFTKLHVILSLNNATNVFRYNCSVNKF